MKAIILKCKPGSLFRLGECSLVDVSHIIHSDTLFSAITNVYELVYESGEEFVKLVEDNKIILSSAFPLLESLKDGNLIYFLPKPKIQFDFNKEVGKKEKKIQFFSLKAIDKILKSLITNEFQARIDLNEIHILDEKYCFLKDEVTIQLDNNSAFIKEIIFPKTAVHKENREDAFYFQTDIQLVPLCDENRKSCYNPHFYFLMQENLSNSEYKKFITCLRILADEGIGGDRGSGRGFIDEVIIKEFDTSIFSGNNLYMSLSLVNPCSQEEFNEVVYYDLMKRGGGSLGLEGKEENHKKQVKMVTEGSIIKKRIKGRIVDISPMVNFYKHRIYRNGKAFLIQIG